MPLMPARRAGRLSGIVWLTLTTASAGKLAAASLEIVSEARLSIDVAHKRVPLWSSGRLLVVENEGTSSPSIVVLDRNGLIESSNLLLIPGAERVWVHGFSRGRDGTVVASGPAIDSQGRRGLYLAILPANRGTIRVIRTGQYQAESVVVAEDGSIWTSGREALDRPPAGNTDPKSVFTPYLASGVVRRFDSQGHQLASFVPQSTIQDLVALGGPRNYLVAAAGKLVAWYCSRERRYVEIGADGTVVDVQGIELVSTPQRSTGLALTSSGRAFLATSDRSGNNWICELDRNAKKWVPVRRESALLYGADGNTLVTGPNRFTIRFLDASQ